MEKIRMDLREDDKEWKEKFNKEANERCEKMNKKKAGWVCEPETNGYFKEMGTHKEWCCERHSNRWLKAKETKLAQNSKLSKSDQ